ncbi:alkaline phosphatase family protein [Microbulbifer rhizosphaerae]|uniref:Putative AlkP superfamily pyrophosphatase or phosphodiesterase n=1 Tax=Microbulbifer rhizosphaerae TaxID=1562603 RepID=A0A7W4ZCE4_9GAMM|nr:nucleotide pyrophosphatase/phosphodiesterase family protein [Microbulbifer rhizosphaerae]MBB3063280.1 putative AlkP superfamily pyrophosphatase or phosphodiesterase [Microbulbifer rhizosphaerae]
MKKTVVLNVVALSPRLIGEHTPFLREWIARGQQASINPVLPAVTCSAQSTYLTGKWPSEHGIVGNGWYFRDTSEVRFWQQSNKLVQAEKVWEEARKRDPNFTCANMFWWYNMYSSVDYAVTPRPLYPADGRKLPDIHTQPMELRDELQKELGQFPLFSFWGPKADITSTRWIADASKKVDQWKNPTLTLIYLPHLDYNLQRCGINFDKISNELREIDDVCRDLITYYENQSAHVILLSEYGITDVSQPVHINRVLRENGYIQVKNELGLETLDAGDSRAFATADHQLAHVYVQNPGDIPAVKEILEHTPGIEHVLDDKGKKQYHLDHSRAGELVAVADSQSWFTYYFWLDDAKAPDYARCVDIHRKPGYDPVETFADPNIPLLPLKVAGKLLKKKLGFRYLMDVIPLDATLVKGSHGRISKDRLDRPLLVTQEKQLLESDVLEPTDVFGLILKHLES